MTVGTMPTLSVSDFVAIFNQSLGMIFPSVGIVGELANFRISKGCWVYFDLKDDEASVRFFGTTRALPGPLEDGMVLEVYGRPYLHPKFGFSVQVDSVQAVGAGSIKKAQSLLEQKLVKEGLFDESRKRALPFPPVRIGLITSSESAAYSDFVKIIKARWSHLQIELYNVAVQGQDAVAQIVRAFEVANQMGDELDVLVLVRGGGSANDLAAFDHEQVVRVVAASRIPTLVAIGHERDVSLSERAADVRASTPSNAAELLVPDRAHESNVLKSLQTELDGYLVSRASSINSVIEHSGELLVDLLALHFRQSAQYVTTNTKFLNVLDPKLPLERGFALVRSASGGMIRTAQAARKEKQIDLEFKDGKLRLKTEEL